MSDHSRGVKRDAQGARPRPKWKRWHVITLAIIGSILVALFSLVPDAAPAGPKDASAPAQKVTQAQACPAGGRERDALLARDAVMRVAPATSAAPITNPNKPPVPEDLESEATATPSTPLRAGCTMNGWTRIRVLVAGLRWMEGWVPNTALKDVAIDASGHRTLTSADFEWDPAVGRDKAAIVKIANRILREDARCEAINGESILIEGEGADRRYTLLCDGPSGDATVTFAPSDVTGRSFKVAASAVGDAGANAIDKADAASACIDEITSRLNQPRSADFHTFTDTTFHVDGSRSRFTVGFTAKNGLGLEVENMAACIFEGKRLVSAEVLPAGS